MDLGNLIGKFGPILGLMIFSWPFVMAFLDRMTKAKAARSESEDRVGETGMGIARDALKQNERWFSELDIQRREQIADREVLKAFGDELKLATDTLLVAVKRVESVLVFMGDMDIRSGSYYKKIDERITEILSAINAAKDKSQ